MAKEDIIILADSKYKFYIEDHIIKCDRYNEPWRDFCGDNAVYSLYQEILDLRSRIEDFKNRISILVAKI